VAVELDHGFDDIPAALECGIHARVHREGALVVPRGVGAIEEEMVASGTFRQAPGGCGSPFNVTVLP
jgi:hypothetical protein